MKEFIEEGFFRKEELLIKALDEGGFPADDGPIAAIRNDHKKSHDSSEVIFSAAKHWQAGDGIARSDVGWATSEYTSAVRLHLERLKNLIFPLLEQTISVDEEHKVSEEMNNIIFEGDLQEGTEKYIKLIQRLEEELGDWK
jgi:hemerythrin-like domain-containing protein